MIAEYRRSVITRHGCVKKFLHSRAEKDIVAQNKAGVSATDEILGKQKGLRQALGPGLDDVVKEAAPL